MAARRSFLEIIHYLFSSKKIYYLLIGLGGLLSFLFLIRSCTVSAPFSDPYLIGQDSRWSELNLLGKERNVTAFNSDVLSAIAMANKINIRLIVGDENQLIRELRDEAIQGILTNTKPSFTNENQFVFSHPYFLTGPVLAISSLQPIQGWNEKAKKIIGLPFYLLNSLNLEQDPSLQLRPYNDLSQALADLNEQRIDGVVFPALAMQIYIQAFYLNRLRIVTTPLTDDGIRLMTLNTKEGKKLVADFNTGLQQIHENGIYDQLLERWGLVNVEKIQSSNDYELHNHTEPVLKLQDPAEEV